jgi:integrase
MASVGRRADGGPGYQVRYRDPGGRQRARMFRRKGDADRFAATVEVDKLRGSYVDPSAGKIALRDYAEQWLAAQTFDEATRIATELRIRLHINPHLGDRPLGGIRPSEIQSWLRTLQTNLAPRYVRVIHSNLAALFNAAIDDDRLAKNPCSASSVRLPALEDGKVQPWTVEQVRAVRHALPARYRILVSLAAGCGLRQGELFGLTVDDVDLKKGVLHVQQQVKILGPERVFASPKGRKTRDVPLPETVALELTAYLQDYPAQLVSLPWQRVDGAPRSSRLVVTSREHQALNRNYINRLVWKPALIAAGLAPTRTNGMHALRHFYASVLLDAGESVRALASYLGHADPGFTLRVYTHLMPASEERTKRAVDRVLGTVHA